VPTERLTFHDLLFKPVPSGLYPTGYYTPEISCAPATWNAGWCLLRAKARQTIAVSPQPSRLGASQATIQASCR